MSSDTITASCSGAARWTQTFCWEVFLALRPRKLLHRTMSKVVAGCPPGKSCQRARAAGCSRVVKAPSTSFSNGACFRFTPKDEIMRWLLRCGATVLGYILLPAGEEQFEGSQPSQPHPFSLLPPQTLLGCGCVGDRERELWDLACRTDPCIASRTLARLAYTTAGIFSLFPFCLTWRRPGALTERDVQCVRFL